MNRLKKYPFEQSASCHCCAHAYVFSDPVVNSKEYHLPTAPTKLAMNRYVWNEDRDVIQLHTKNERVISPRSNRLYHSAIAPPSTVSAVSLDDLSVNSKEYFRVKKEMVKTPHGSIEGEIIEEGKKILYYLDGKRVSPSQYYTHFQK